MAVPLHKTQQQQQQQQQGPSDSCSSDPYSWHLPGTRGSWACRPRCRSAQGEAGTYWWPLRSLHGAREAGLHRRQRRPCCSGRPPWPAESTVINRRASITDLQLQRPHQINSTEHQQQEHSTSLSSAWFPIFPMNKENWGLMSLVSNHQGMELLELLVFRTAVTHPAAKRAAVNVPSQ